MAADAPNPTPFNPLRFSVPLPRPLWFGLTATLAIVVAVGLELGLPIYRKHLAMREIERAGGSVVILPCGPIWLQSLVGDQWLKPFSVVKSIDLQMTKFDDAGMALMKDLPDLRGLNLYGTRVTDAGLKNLTGLQTLQYLELSSTPVTDAGLSSIKSLMSLRELYLDYTAVTDKGLAHVTSLANLERLSLDSTGVTDAGLQHLHALKGLERLSLSDTDVTDIPGVFALKRKMPRLRYVGR